MAYVGANLESANLNQALLAEANFNNANLAKANLRNTKAGRAQFMGADLSGANLTHAEIAGVSFLDANVAGTDFTQTVPNKTLLTAKNFKDCLNLDASGASREIINAWLKANGKPYKEPNENE